jgi:hypothetical protein
VAEAPRIVSRFEASLLTLLRHLLGHDGAGDAGRLLTEKRPRPVCLSSNAVALVKDTLAKGSVRFLVRHGGWRGERHVRNGNLVGGRAWVRTPLAERSLHFSADVLEFLIWLTAESPSKPGEPWRTLVPERTAADDLFFTVVLAAMESDPDLTTALREKPPFASNGLARLACPGVYAASDAAVPDFALWFTASRAAILECLQPWLAARWLASERGKGRIGDWAALGRLGAAEERVATAFVTAAADAGRPDLARFLLRAEAGAFANSDRTPEYWTGGLEGAGPSRLADRVAVRRGAVAGPRLVGTLAALTRRYRAVGYFDEGYPAAQLWKDDWEAAGGDELAERARRVVDAVEPLRAEG